MHTLLSHLEKISTKVENFLPFILAFSLIAFLPITDEPYETIRTSFLILMGLLTLIHLSVRVITQRKITLRVDSVSVPLLLFFLGSVIATFANSNSIGSLTSPFGPVLPGVLFLMHSIVYPNFPDERKKYLLTWLLLITGFLALSVLLWPVITPLIHPTDPSFLSPLFTFAGTPVAFLAITFSLLPLTIYQVLVHSQKSSNKTLFFFILLALYSGSFALLAIKFFPLYFSKILPLEAGIAIILRQMTNPRQFIVGIGADNFINIYTLYKPLWLLTSPLWNVRFGTNATGLLHVLATSGVVGTAGLVLFLLFSLITAIKRSLTNFDYLPYFLSLLSIALCIGIFPPAASLLILFSLIVLLGTKNPQSSYVLHIPVFLRYIVSLPIVLLVIAGNYVTIRWFFAEILYKKALVAISENNSSQAYNLLRQSANVNPYRAKTYAILSQNASTLAISLANADSQNASSSAKISNNQDVVQKLVSQSVSDAKRAINIAPDNVFYWENLSLRYEKIANVASGARDWQSATLKKALELDPTNPLIRIQLADILHQNGQWQNALEVLESALQLKPDLTLAYVKIAELYREKNQKDTAVLWYQKALPFTANAPDDKRLIESNIHAILEN